MTDSILILKGLKKVYPAGFQLEIPLLSFEKGNIYSLVGPNGSGKTTLLSLIALLISPDEGEIAFLGKEILKLPKKEQLRLRRKISFLPEEPYIFRGSVSDNISYGLRLRGISREEIKKRVADIAPELGISHLMNKKARELSAGERKRVAFARATVIKPDLLLLDEPVANIDKGHIGLVEKFIRTISRRGATVIFSTHEFSLAYRLSQRVIPLQEGKIGEFLPDNLFPGECISEGDELFIVLPNGIKVATSEKSNEARVLISISTREIILSRRTFQSSARNSFSGKVKKVAAEGDGVRVSLDVGGIEFVSLITERSYQELGINIGSEIYLTFKASAVRIL
jgi:molybdopterin-binding protein